MYRTETTEDRSWRNGREEDDEKSRRRVCGITSRLMISYTLHIYTQVRLMPTLSNNTTEEKPSIVFSFDRQVHTRFWPIQTREAQKGIEVVFNTMGHDTKTSLNSITWHCSTRRRPPVFPMTSRKPPTSRSLMVDWRSRVKHVRRDRHHHLFTVWTFFLTTEHGYVCVSFIRPDPGHLSPRWSYFNQRNGAVGVPLMDVANANFSTN